MSTDEDETILSAWVDESAREHPGALDDPCQSVADQRWRVGDRVCHDVFLDDGTWTREGDDCLSRSPLKYGVVERIYLEERRPWWNPGARRLWLYEVLWDDGTRHDYFWHGLRAA